VVPLGVPRQDPAGAEVRAQLVADAVISVPLKIESAAAAGLVQVHCEVTHQGCRAGLCWPEITTAITAPVAILAAPTVVPE